MQWETVIGLEVHAQLSTRSKIFSGAATAYGAAPNSQACAVDIALPGVLPVLNRSAVEKAIKFGLAVGANVNRHSVFARKNYFYPDLPKGYQISQYELPIVEKGSITIQVEDKEKVIRLVRAHLEEDAGKSLHEDFHGISGIDLNRAGTPLLEIVSEPDMRGAAEAVAYAKTLHALVRYLEICDGNMQEGSFRCDANVSVRPAGSEALGTRCEIKNLNSFRFLERAIEFEAARQIQVLGEGGKIRQETRLYDSIKDETRSMRSKEEANDYRYFPDPDLLPLAITEDMVNKARATLPELPAAKRARFMSQYGLSAYDAEVLTASREKADFYEAAAREAVKVAGAIPKEGAATAMATARMMTIDEIYKLCANWVNVELGAKLNREGLDITESAVSAVSSGQLFGHISKGTISGKIAKDVYEDMWGGGGSADAIIEAKGLKQISDTGALEKIVDEVISQNPAQLADYRAGKDRLLGFFVGQVMKATQGKANPAQINELLKRKLST